MNAARSGFFAMLAAVLIWGNLVLIFAHIAYIRPIDIIAHRVFWGMLTLLIWLGFKGRLGDIKTAFQDIKATLFMAVCAFLVAANWFGFVWAVTNQKTIEAGLGYFIYPLVTVAFGALFNQERLNQAQAVAVSLTILAVLVLTFGLGRLPWISLYLAFTFAAYSLLKAKISQGAVISVSVENLILAPLALIWIIGFAEYGFDFNRNLDAGFWLILSGVLTALALIGFSHAAKTIGLIATGMMFFINPILQVFNATAILGEPLTLWHKIAFPLILLGCAIYCYDLWRRGRALSVEAR